jgi:hypothetical protein
MKKLTLFIICAFVLFSSSSDNIKLDFDNPTKKAQKITFDGKEFTLWALSAITKEVPRGEHTLQIGNDSVIKYNFHENEYLINPLRANYVIHNIQYSRASLVQFGDMLSEAREKEAKLLGQELGASFEVFDDLIKAKDWDFKHREKVPEIVTIREKSYSFSKTMRKLYAPDELEELLKSTRRR